MTSHVAENVIEFRKLSRLFGETVALHEVNLTIPRGCVFGLVGENGAGKTTLLKHILGLLKPTHGVVRVFGKDPVAEPVDVLGRVGYLSEDRELPDWMRIAELLHYTSAFYPDWDRDYADDLRAMFELDPQQKVKHLSRGNRARVGLVLALAHRPDLLLLDEPSSGLDPVVRRDILAAIIRTVADEGRTVLFSSHLLDEVQRVCDHVAVLHQGRLLLSSPLDEMLEKHYRLTVRFEQSQPVKPVITGALTCVGDGHEWTIVCNGQRQIVENQLRDLQAEIVEDGLPSLDEVFVARISA